MYTTYPIIASTLLALLPAALSAPITLTPRNGPNEILYLTNTDSNYYLYTLSIMGYYLDGPPPEPVNRPQPSIEAFTHFGSQRGVSDWSIWEGQPIVGDFGSTNATSYIDAGAMEYEIGQHAGYVIFSEDARRLECFKGTNETVWSTARDVYHCVRGSNDTYSEP